MKYLDREQVIARVNKAVKEAGGQAALAKKLGVTDAYISQVVQLHKTPGKKLRQWIGVDRVSDLWVATK